MVHQVRYANIFSQAAALLASNLADDTFMTKADVCFDQQGTRQLGELNRGKLWERTENHEDFPEVTLNFVNMFLV